jgi:uncharacterized cupin superfamily protein
MRGEIQISLGTMRAPKRARAATPRVPLYQHVRADAVAPPLRARAAGWPEWRCHDDQVRIEYDGDYASERVLVLSGRATVVPEDGSRSFTVGPGDAVYFMVGFKCTWRIDEAPLVQRYGFFGDDGREIQETVLTCDVCGDDCFEESYLYDDKMDICPRCFKLDSKSAQQYEGAKHQREGKAAYP